MEESLMYMYILLGVLGVFFALIIAVIIGRLMDPVFRAGAMRKYLKKNYMVFGIVSNDWKTVKHKVINADSDALMIDGRIYAIDSEKVYRIEKESKTGYKTQEIDTKVGKKLVFDFNKVPKRWEEGVPIIYIDRDNITPLTWQKGEEKTNPEGLGSVLSDWITNQETKRQTARGSSISLTEIAKFVLLIGILGIGLYCAVTIDQIVQGGIGGDGGNVIYVPAGAEYVDGNIVITQGD